ncbi:MAG: hypothetical protein IJF10_01060 [Clostridia bacterium]|nr:hypothetical protein [Clostridia bacterium]
MVQKPPILDKKRNTGLEISTHNTQTIHKVNKCQLLWKKPTTGWQNCLLCGATRLGFNYPTQQNNLNVLSFPDCNVHYHPSLHNTLALPFSVMLLTEHSR